MRSSRGLPRSAFVALLAMASGAVTLSLFPAEADAKVLVVNTGDAFYEVSELPRELLDGAPPGNWKLGYLCSHLAIFWADVVPTTHHLQPSYIMAYDIDVARSFKSRSKWLAKAAAEGWIGLFYHDPDHAFGRVRREGKRYVFQEVSTDR